MELAMSQLKVPPQALQDFNVLNMIARLALVFKIYDDIAQKIGLGLVYKSLIPEHTHNHDHNHKHTHNDVPNNKAGGSEHMKDEEGQGTSHNQDGNKKGSASKILIADE